MTTPNILLKYYGVIGHPIRHSLSPIIHHAFAKEFDIPLQYDAIDIEPNDFEHRIEMLKRQGYLGFNITVPFKEIAYHWANQKTARAEIAKAVNTLYFEQNDVFGDNTDGIGLMRDLTINQQLNLEHKQILLLGAGGALRGILFQILQSKPSHVHIANRTVEKLDIILKEFSSYGSFSVSDLNHIPSTLFDLVINTTSFGVTDSENIFPDNLFSKYSFFYDLVYNIKNLTPFLQLAKRHGATKLCDGLGMLIEQAAESFFIWHNVRPQTKNIIQELKKKEI